jgi:diguanylate cyclase (GGDEF)-like protein/PAS domain S-box-containing protein
LTLADDTCDREEWAVLHSSPGHLAETLEAIHLGIMMVMANGDVAVCNPAALMLLDLPPGLHGHVFNLGDVAAKLHGLHLGPDDDGQAVSFQNTNGLHLEIQVSRIEAHGMIIVIEDVSEQHARDRARQFAEAEYRSLFRNAVCGIYRDQLDGIPVRCNPALALLNGYQTEEEYITAVSGAHGAWYVEPTRSDEFKRLMREEGRVKDFVSEVYRHRTRERIWITENAWYVRDPEGNPLFIEGTIQDATERVATLSVIERQANIDTLTSVASRFRFFNEMADGTAPESAGCTLHSIDLDRFKEVNDHMGHAAGDHVLKVSAQRLLSLCGGHDIVARLGGDEFAILQHGATGEDEAREFAARIVEVMSEPVDIGGRHVVIGASVGVAIHPTLAGDAEELLGNADLALYQAKATGRNGYRIFDADLRVGIQRRQEFASELRAAIAGEELELYYQPIVHSGSGETEGYEALLRWNHPTRGLLHPQQFIPYAEEAGLMTELGAWATERACEQGGLLPKELRISVNVSPSQFRSAGIVSGLRGILERTGFDPRRLILEITETAILPSEVVAKKVLFELKEMGVGVALDDFGTAYSSLSYLQRFAFDKVKIDRSFVASMFDDPASAAIVRAVVGIGRDLRIDVVAEGVETQALVEGLAAEGCTHMQGYYFGHPKCFADVVNDIAVGRLVTKLPARQDFGQRLRLALSA